MLATPHPTVKNLLEPYLERSIQFYTNLLGFARRQAVA
jgi:hypothetical protein